ncbi:MAG: hypothetical protein NUV97_01125 [archaeon]|nr:hypothetical protein [archaeon]MCR4323436.1 hypothetical protein [Nanoarchaeota archaeon]
MKKKMLTSLVTLFSFSLVSAADVSGEIQKVGVLLGWIGELVGVLLKFISLVLFTPPYDNQELIYTKLLFFFLTFIVIYFILNKNKILSDKKGLNFIIGLAISILAVRYLPDELIQGIRIPYGALSVAILVFLPLAIFFFFLHNSNNFQTFGRRAGWVIFAAAFIALWYYDSSKIGITNIIYWIGLGFVILSFIFDNAIHKWFGLADYRQGSVGAKTKLRDKMTLKILEMREEQMNYLTATPPQTAAAERVGDRIKEMEKALRNIG